MQPAEQTDSETDEHKTQNSVLIVVECQRVRADFNFCVSQCWLTVMMAPDLCAMQTGIYITKTPKWLTGPIDE